MQYTVSEVAGIGDEYPVPGADLMTVEAESAVEALNAYSEREGFAPYAPSLDPDEGAIVPFLWNDEGTIASAPFTNYEIIAYTYEAMVACGMFNA